ncbi:MAG: hypothetical protein JJ957_13795 [Pseudomonadales bacterium]|nr:hypothetical protein [Pseudomonadales bacterium]MBO6596610.1 hypothetical protein [Pseudomonadales bacterium]MBO6823401.1 hypothetical protein [Pseudomonadales bacterium]
MELDDEVPLHNKLLVSYQDLNHAVEIHSNTKRIDPIVKSEEFLGSPEMRLRLLFNALTTPNYCVGGMCNDYLFYKERAELGLVTLSDKISGKDTPTTTRVDDLIRSDDGKEGEDYLGYKNLRPVRSYLQYILHKNTTNPGD